MRWDGIGSDRIGSNGMRWNEMGLGGTGWDGMG